MSVIVDWDVCTWIRGCFTNSCDVELMYILHQRIVVIPMIVLCENRVGVTGTEYAVTTSRNGMGNV